MPKAGEVDLIWEALCSVCGIQGNITPNERGRVNEARKQLVSVYQDNPALPMMIHERAAAYRQAWPDMALTPQALVSNWSTILDEAERVRDLAKRKAVNAPASHKNCICGGDRMVLVGTDKNGGDLAAPCPECGTDNASHYMSDRYIRVMDKGEAREMMRPRFLDG